MENRMKKIFFTAAVLLSLLLASCAQKGPSTSINVVLGDFQFAPNEFIVPAGQEISFTAVNNGAVVHNFVVMKAGTDAGPVFEDDDVPNVYWEVELVPGADVNTSFTAPTEPGEYQVVCRTGGHIASGMIAKLVVVAGN
jgi:plastocyanin